MRVALNLMPLGIPFADLFYHSLQGSLNLIEDRINPPVFQYQDYSQRFPLHKGSLVKFSNVV